MSAPVTSVDSETPGVAIVRADAAGGIAVGEKSQTDGETPK
jgi:hypothetical protein